MRELWELFWTFAKMSAITFGGGAAMLPLLQRELVEKRQWVTEEELMDYYAISQCTPGIIAINSAVFVGQKKRGDLGGAAAALGIVFPSLVIVTILASIITNVADLAWVQNAFAGIRACVCVQIFNSVLKLAKKSVIGVGTALIFVAVFLGSVFLDLSPVWCVLASAAAGIVLEQFRLRREGERT